LTIPFHKATGSNQVLLHLNPYSVVKDLGPLWLHWPYRFPHRANPTKLPWWR
jgi:hypothetical protein